MRKRPASRCSYSKSKSVCAALCPQMFAQVGGAEENQHAPRILENACVTKTVETAQATEVIADLPDR